MRPRHHPLQVPELASMHDVVHTLGMSCRTLLDSGSGREGVDARAVKNTTDAPPILQI